MSCVILGHRNYTYKNNNIILVGYHGIIHKRNDSWNEMPFFYKFKTQYRFYIDLDTDIILKQRFYRHLKFMLKNKKMYYEKTLKNPLCIDFDKWRKKIRFNDPHYRDLGYNFLSPAKIYKTVTKIIKSL